MKYGNSDVKIIGGSAAGATAAVSCKRRNSDKSVLKSVRRNRSWFHVVYLTSS
jgi:thioredoxin reductase